MTENPATKFVLDQATLHGSDDLDLRQRVATVYVNRVQYDVTAPPEAKGDAVDWTRHFVVRQKAGLDADEEVEGALRVFILRGVEEELKSQKKKATRVPGKHPDGKHCATQICLNGHVLHCDGHPFDSKAHCTQCGSSCIDECPKCEEPIRGVQIYASVSDYVRPQFCHGCGKPYPWMEDRLNTAQSLRLRLVVTQHSVLIANGLLQIFVSRGLRSAGLNSSQHSG